MSRKADPRPARTRALLWEALIELIQEKRWERITVQDILDRTGVGRSTFYAHFDNKLDLLTSEVPTLALPISSGSGKPDLLPIFEHVAEFRPIMLPLMSQPMLSEMLDTLHRHLATAWIEHVEAAGVPTQRQPMAAEILTGSFMAVTRSWLKAGCSPAPDKMCDEFSAYALAVIEVARA